MNILLRNIKSEDNDAIATVIRSGLKDFDADLPGTVYFDPTTDDLFKLFTTPLSAYFVATEDNKVIGGAGYFPTHGLPQDTCELVKMYLDNNYRGKGIGKLLLDHTMLAANRDGFKFMYLETLPQLNRAVEMYEKNGFIKLKAPMGDSGHFGCNMWMIKEL